MRNGQFENIQKVFGVTGRFLAVAVGEGRVEEGSRRTAISFVISASGHRRIRSTSQLEWNLFLRADGGEWIGLCQRPDALAVRQIFGIGRDSGRFALPVDIWGLACRKLNLTIQKSQDGGSSALSLAHAAFPLPRKVAYLRSLKRTFQLKQNTPMFVSVQFLTNAGVTPSSATL